MCTRIHKRHPNKLTLVNTLAVAGNYVYYSLLQPLLFLTCFDPSINFCFQFSSWGTMSNEWMRRTILPSTRSSGLSGDRLKGSVGSDNKWVTMVARSAIMPLLGNFTGSRIKVYSRGSGSNQRNAQRWAQGPKKSSGMSPRSASSCCVWAKKVCTCWEKVRNSRSLV